MESHSIKTAMIFDKSVFQTANKGLAFCVHVVSELGMVDKEQSMKQLEQRSPKAFASVRRDSLCPWPLFSMAVACFFPSGKITRQTGGSGI